MNKFPTALTVLLVLLLAGCESYSPDRNTATSGHLVVLVDEMYAPLIRDMADSFMVRSPAAKITITPMSAREGVEEWINRHLADTSVADTGTAVAIVLGRRLLDDEKEAIASRNLEKELIEIPIAYDGLAVVVPNQSQLQQTTLERLQAALARQGRTSNDLQEGAGGEALRFIFPDPNSSAYSLIRTTLLNQNEPAAPATYRRTSDSVLNAVAAGEGISLMGWYCAHQDSTRVRTLELGFVDSAGLTHSPVRIHTVSLVTGAYPLKLPIVGFTFARVNSLANGFLTWMAQSAQTELSNRGLEGENVRYRFTE